MKIYDQLYIGGKWLKPCGTGTIDVIDSGTEEIMGRIPEGTEGDAEAAIAAARAAFDSWAMTPAKERAAFVKKITDNLKARTDELAGFICGEVGMPLKLARAIQVGGPVYNWGAYAKLAAEFQFEERVGNSLVVREPVGVVAAITPWNYPLNQITLKVAAALAAGCTIVLKPSEVAPLNAFVLAEAHHEAREPAKEAAEAFVAGDPRVESTRLGPLASAAQQSRVQQYIARGIEEGADLVTGGPGMPDGVSKGFFVKPTVFGRVHPKATIA